METEQHGEFTYDKNSLESVLCDPDTNALYSIQFNEQGIAEIVKVELDIQYE